VRVADLNGTSGTLKPRQLARLTTGSYGLSFEHEVERHEYYGPRAEVAKSRRAQKPSCALRRATCSGPIGFSWT
jgi:hypothetical protein